MFRFELLLDQVDRKMQPAYLLKKETIESGIKPSSSEIDNSQKELDEAPIKEMFEAYVNRVDSRGEQGVLCSINQRLWREYMELKAWLINQR